MFSKLKNFSEDVAKSISELNINEEQAQVVRSKGLVNELKNNAAVLATETPDESELVQPEDEPETETNEKEAKDVDVKVNEVNMDDLPPILKSKMKKFAKYEEKYPILLEAFKVEKRKTELITSFEKVLRECTPISSISDAGLLVEYLNQLTQKTNLLNQEIKKYNRENIELTKNNKNLTNQVTTLNDKVKILQDNTADETLIKSLNDDLKLKQTEIDQLELANFELKQNLERKSEDNGEVEKLSQENKSLIDKIAELEKNSSDADLQQKLANAETEKGLLNKQIDELKQNLENKGDAALEIDKLSKEKQNLIDQISVLEEKSPDFELQQKVVDAETLLLNEKQIFNKQIDDLTSKQLKIDSENANLKSKLGESDTKISSQLNSINEYESKVKDLNVKIEELEVKLQNSIPAAAPTTPGKKKNNKKKKGNGNNNVKSVEPETTNQDNLTELLDRAIAEKELLENDLSKLKQEHDSTCKDFDESNAERRKLRGELELNVEELDSMRDLLRDLGDDLCQAKDEIKALKLSTNNEKDTENLKHKVETISKELDQLKQQNVKLEKDINAKDEEIKVKVVDIRTLQGEKETLDKKVVELSTQIKADLAQHESKMSIFEKDLETHTKNLDTSKASETALKTKNEELIKNQQTLTSKITSLEKEVTVLKQEKSEMSSRIDDLNKHKGNDASLKLEIASLSTSLNHKDEQIRDFKDKVVEFYKQKDELNQQISDLKLAKNNLEYENKSLVREKTDLINKQELAAERTTTLSNELSKKQIERQTVATELEKLKTKYDSIVKEKLSINDNVESFRQEYEELSMKSKEASMRIESLEDELNESRTLLQERTRETITIKRLLADAEEHTKSQELNLRLEIKKAHEEKQELESENQKLMKRKQRETQEYKSISDNYLLKIKELEESLQQLTSKHDLLKNKTTNGDTQMDDEVQKTIETLRQSLQATSKRVRDYESLNNTLKKLNEESNMKFDRLSKNYKILTQQYRQMKSPSQTAAVSRDNSLDSPRDSLDKESGEKGANIAYLKNVLLGFFEHKEQREQLLPVVKTLFNFSVEDEKKFLVALK